MRIILVKIMMNIFYDILYLLVNITSIYNIKILHSTEQGQTQLIHIRSNANYFSRDEAWVAIIHLKYRFNWRWHPQIQFIISRSTKPIAMRLKTLKFQFVHRSLHGTYYKRKKSFKGNTVLYFYLYLCISNVYWK